MTEEKKKIIVVGDVGIDQFIYVEGLPNQPPNLREAWVEAKRFWTAELRGGAGSLVECLRTLGYEAVEPFRWPEDPAESIYILTPQDDPDGPKWRGGLAIVSGERDQPRCELTPLPDEYPDSIPAIFVDFDQGCRKHNKDHLAPLLKNRPYLVRTHDPRKEEWVAIRNKNLQEGIWFSPLQDMSDGALKFPGNWEDVYDRLIRYLKADDTLWSGQQWKQTIAIQIYCDGVLVLRPGEENAEGSLWIFAGDQPRSFERNGYRAVIGGGIVFLAALAKALYNRELLDHVAKEGLIRTRTISEKGYIGPAPNAEDWELGSSTNLPLAQIQDSDTDKILLYGRRAPAGDWETVVKIVAGVAADLRKVTTLNIGNLVTCCPNYAHTLLRLESRLKNHVDSGKGILSFTVFGGPGSGKSFVAEQLAKAVDPTGNTFQVQVFNISQFGDPSRLQDALQQIQAIGLQGKTAFVLWDEFDTAYEKERGAWLQYFLMPMQDAKFFDGISERTLGKCVFAFIGGTFEDEAEFKEWALDPDKGKDLKAVDFHSRLDSSLTVPPVDLKPDEIPSWDTPHPTKLVRAIMIRNFLRGREKIKKISHDVLAYLTHVPLEHGVRSLQRIITASEPSKTSIYDTSHLPPRDVLQLHVKNLAGGDTDHVRGFLKNLPGYPMQEKHDPIPLQWRKQT